MEEKKISDGIISRVIDKIFSLRKSTIYLILIFILGLILRVIAAINLGVSADDMHHVVHAVNFLNAGRLITYDQSSGLWHSFTSIIYNIFGFTQLSSRFAALFFGSFSILTIYLLTREFFNKKVSLTAAFLLAIAPFHIKNTIAEMDVMTMFFVLLSFLFFVKALKTDKRINYGISGIFMGLSIYTKVYPLLFIPSLLIYFIYFNKKYKKNWLLKENVKRIAVFLFFAFIFTLPALTHNYLLYKDKGFFDLQFTRGTGLGKNISTQYYSWDAQFSAKNSWKGLIFGDKMHIPSGKPLLLGAIDYIRLGDPINFYLGILGIVLILLNKKEKKDYFYLFLFSILFVLPFLASIILLPKHYLFLEILLIPMGSLIIPKIANKFHSKLENKITIGIFIVLFSISLFLLSQPITSMPHFYGKSSIEQIIDFKDSNIQNNALIISDSRIYRGTINWFSQGRPYLEASQFIELANQQDNLPGNLASVDVYYFECIIDDCGWGTIKNQPEFNASMESFTDFFKKNGRLIKTINEPDREKIYFPVFAENRKNIINIYKTQLQLKDSIVQFAKQPKNWFLYDIGYEPKDKQFDYYQTHSFFDTLLDKIAHYIVLLATILAFLSPIYVIYLILKDEKDIGNNSSV